MRRWWKRRARRDWPRLSVIIPMYNVAEFLDDCLTSVLGQPVPNLEVMLIDDGSTDATAALAQAWVARDSRVRLHQQPNGGVSKARNVAMELISGDLVTFVDPDDTLPADAWGRMIEVLAETGSDFAVGNMPRVDADGRHHRLPLLSRNHAEDRFGVRLEDQPLMLADVFPCNKVFRTGFWRSAGVTFPEGVRYEDQVALTEAFLAADRFDVHAHDTYWWRIRDDLTSATQARAQLRNLSDRIVTKRMTVARVAADPRAPALLPTLYAEILPIDFWEHFRAAVRADLAEPDAYWQMLRDGLAEFYNSETIDFAETTVPESQREMARLVAEDRRGDLRDWLESLADRP